MRCAICKKEENEIELFEGIKGAGMIRICEPCSKNEGIPTIRKPSSRQLEKADERYSVRERMEEMSGMRKKSEVSDEQIALQGKLARLRAPPKKEHNDNVVDDYAWSVTIARRRRKMSIGQLAKETDLDYNIIQGVEKGRIPQDYTMVFSVLEKYLKIKLLKVHPGSVNFTRNIDEEKEILKRVQERMSGTEIQDSQISLDEESDKDLEIPEDLEDISIDSLVERKKAKERTRMHYHPKKERIETDAMLGSDIELDLDLDEL